MNKLNIENIINTLRKLECMFPFVLFCILLSLITQKLWKDQKEVFENREYCAFFTYDWKLIEENYFPVNNGEIKTIQKDHTTKIYFVYGRKLNMIPTPNGTIIFKHQAYIFQENQPMPITVPI